jgi:hypothetical protein
MAASERPRRGTGKPGFFFIIGWSFLGGMLEAGGLRYLTLDSDHVLLVVAGCASLGFAIFLAVEFIGILRELGIANKPADEPQSFSHQRPLFRTAKLRLQ